MLSPAETIQRKRDGQELTDGQLQDFIRGLQTGAVTDYQATAFLMATFFRGMTLAETVSLTQAMLESGERYRLEGVPGPKVDKHSTGGVGDKVSLILAPLAAACGLTVPMMSGRGLGHTGGTLDKLEAIPGFSVKLDRAGFERVLSQVGCAMIGQSEKMVPADRKLYALRDVTATVECIPLITASILSKKLAEGSEALILDVKVGSGAFMKSRPAARDLARTLVKVARKLGMPCRALLTDMSQPLGYAVGNALEVRECVDILRGQPVLPEERNAGSADLKELTVQLCAQMLEVSGKVRSVAEGRKLAHARLNDGKAWERFQALVKAQGGDVSRLASPDGLPVAEVRTEWKAARRGYLTRMDAEGLGRILVELGGGRKKASDGVDPAVGLVFHRKLGARVSAGETLVTVHSRPGQALEELEKRFQSCLEISPSRKTVPKLVLEVVG